VEAGVLVRRDALTLDALEPYLGLDPLAERTGEQLGLFSD